MNPHAPRIREAGDSALLIEWDEAIDPEINARAIATAAAIRAAVPGLRDVVSTYRSVAVFFDPLTVEAEGLRALLAQLSEEARAVTTGKIIEVPVTYGGEAGPDLTAVAEWAGVSRDAVIERHTGTEYRVFMLGFLPGFAYLGSVDASIAAPRRGTPRLRVPAGSVGIAGRQTGIYPRESPGGWQLIGWSGVKVFDVNRSQPSLFVPGDAVRFSASRVADALPRDNTRQTNERRSASHSRTVTVVRPGLFTTVQDLGRWGQQASGVPVSGAMDLVAHRIANLLVGNEQIAGTLEATLSGPELRMEQETRVAITGADLQATVDGTVAPVGVAMRCRAGSVLRFGARQSGARAYVAFDGGVDVPVTFGSRSTHVGAALGGIEGRALAAGDRLPLGSPGERQAASSINVRIASSGVRLRILPGPQDDFFSEPAFTLLERTRFVVTPQSNRMGYRLSGASIPRARDREMISDATFVGAIQVPASGEPILLMSDRQTTGGYPQMATVIAADLPLAGQLAPGDWVEFARCTRTEAIAALRDQEAMLGGRA